MSYHEIERRVSKAKGHLVLRQPFIATLAFNLKVRIDPNINPPTMCTNGEDLIIHPDWVASHDNDELMWALGHETFHCVFKHMLKSNVGPRNFNRWNIAADVVVNCLLEEDRVGKRPKNVIWDASPTLGGRTAQDLYAEGKSVYGVYALLPENCGEGGGGGLWDKIEPFTGDASQQAELAAKWAVLTAQAMAVAKAQGKASAAMQRVVGELLKPKVNWKEQLRHFCTKAYRADRSWARPNRRLMRYGYMPGLGRSYNMSGLVVAVDLSGSISAEDLREFSSEMAGIKADLNPDPIHVLYFDSKVSKHDIIERDDDLRIEPFGGGGTAFSPIFEFIEDHDLQPVACVVLTDLCCNDFGPQPEYPVMWCSNMMDRAPWGEVLMIK